MIAAKHVLERSLPGRVGQRKMPSISSNSDCFSCSWVGFPPAPRFQLRTGPNLPAVTTFNHFLPHLSCKSFIVKQKLISDSPTLALNLENTKACGLTVG